jgi:ribulose-phosphate 3-epimerase
MIDNPEKNLEDWIFLKPKRLILQLEAIKDFDFIYDKTKKTGIELGLAICPETPVSSLYKYMDKVNFVLMLGVIPGPSGQEFENYVLDKIKDLKKKYPKTMIELDGGVNMEIARKATLAGADYLVTGSFIFNSPNPLEALEILKKSI